MLPSQPITHPERHYMTLDTDKETLLALQWIDPSTLDNGIDTRHANPLRRSWTLQPQEPIASTTNLSFGILYRSRFDSIPGPCSFQCITDGEEDSTTHEEWGFTNSTRLLDRAQVLPFDVLQQRNIELLRYVAEAWDFIGTLM